MTKHEKASRSLLKSAFEEAACRDIEELAQEEKHTFSSAFQQRMQRVACRSRRHTLRICGSVLGYAAAAAAMLVLCVYLPWLKTQTRLVAPQVVVHSSSGAEVFSFGGDITAPQPETYYPLDMVPAGYEYVGELEDMGSLFVDWRHENGSILGYAQGPLNHSFRLGLDGCTMTRVRIALTEKTYARGHYYRRDGFAVLIWTGEDRYYRLMLRGPDANVMDLAELAESIEEE